MLPFMSDNCDFCLRPDCKCIGCEYEHPSQLKHMGLGGCLNPLPYSPEPEPVSEPDLDNGCIQYNDCIELSDSQSTSEPESDNDCSDEPRGIKK